MAAHEGRCSARNADIKRIMDELKHFYTLYLPPFPPSLAPLNYHYYTSSSPFTSPPSLNENSAPSNTHSNIDSLNHSIGSGYAYTSSVKQYSYFRGNSPYSTISSLYSSSSSFVAGVGNFDGNSGNGKDFTSQALSTLSASLTSMTNSLTSSLLGEGNSRRDNGKLKDITTRDDIWWDDDSTPIALYEDQKSQLKSSAFQGKNYKDDLHLGRKKSNTERRAKLKPKHLRPEEFFQKDRSYNKPYKVERSSSKGRRFKQPQKGKGTKRLSDSFKSSSDIPAEQNTDNHNYIEAEAESSL